MRALKGISVFFPPKSVQATDLFLFMGIHLEFMTTHTRNRHKSEGDEIGYEQGGGREEEIE